MLENGVRDAMLELYWMLWPIQMLCLGRCYALKCYTKQDAIGLVC